MIDHVLITPDGRRTESREDVKMCLYNIERGFWSACGWSEDEYAVQLDWGGIPRERSSGFFVAREGNVRSGDGLPVPAHIRPLYKFDKLELLAVDYVRDLGGGEYKEPGAFNLRGDSPTHATMERAKAYRREGMPYPWIAGRIKTRNGSHPSPHSLSNWLRNIECRTVPEKAGWQLMNEVYNDGHSVLEIVERTGLSRRLVKMILREGDDVRRTKLL